MNVCGCGTGHEPGCLAAGIPATVLATEQFIRGDCIDVAARLTEVLEELDAVRGAANALLDVAIAERDAARADADRLAEALRNEGHCHPLDCGRCRAEVECSGASDAAREALRLHDEAQP